MTYYRLHRDGLPTFGSDRAWSGPWGESYSADGSAYECRTCDGTGEWLGEPCPDRCDDGWLPADRGYSCCHGGRELVRYVVEHIGAHIDDERVVIFEGRQVGTGLDGEPLVIPTRVVRWTTVRDLRRDHDHQ